MNKYLRVLFNPVETGFYIISRWRPQLLWQRYYNLAQKAGFKKLYLVLSFDCDTPEDAKVVLDVDNCLQDMEIKAVYAVPGAILEKDEKVYSELCQRKVEFLNHGYKEHTFWNEKLSRYESCFFYNQLPLEQIIEDIEKGDEVLKKILGLTPLGFRTPHFGTFQKIKQLKFLHSLLKNMGYRYSSSTSPFYAFRYGPFFDPFEILELPVSGSFSNPLSVMDSWGFYKAPDRKYKPEDFLTEAKALTYYCKEKKMVGILNYYADPSHIWNQPTFFEAVKLLKEVAEPIDFQTLCSMYLGTQR